MSEPTCPKCKEVGRMIEHVDTIIRKDGKRELVYACAVCGHEWKVKP